jgi:hypothetical protein
MNIQTYRIKKTVRRYGKLLACLPSLVTLLLPSLAFAQSKTYAMACGPNAATVKVASDGSLSCQGGSAPNEAVSVAGTGSDPSKYPSGAKLKTLTVVTVKCAKGNVKPFASGSAHFSCTKGSAKVTVVKVIPVVSTLPGPTPPPAPASPCSDTGCDLVENYINPLINLLSVIFGLVAVASLIMGGIQYTASEGDPQKISKAKNRLTNTVIAILAYSVLYGFLQFLVPGGLFQG